MAEETEIETEPTRVFRVELLAIDNDGEMTEDELITLLEQQRYFAVRVARTDVRTVDWHDEHPLNIDGWRAAFRKLFGVS